MNSLSKNIRACSDYSWKFYCNFAQCCGRTHIFFLFFSRSISEKCTQVDSSATDALGRLLLDALTYCSLLHSPKEYTAKLSLPLKERIIILAIRQPQIENGRVNTDPFYQLDQLRIKLENFIELEKAQTVMNRLLASVNFPFEKRNGNETFETRKTLVARHCFSPKECEAISALVVKKLDPTFQLHCDQPNCGENCKFFRIPCHKSRVFFGNVEDVSGATRQSMYLQGNRMRMRASSP